MLKESLIKRVFKVGNVSHKEAKEFVEEILQDARFTVKEEDGVAFSAVFKEGGKFYAETFVGTESVGMSKDFTKIRPAIVEAKKMVKPTRILRLIRQGV